MSTSMDTQQIGWTVSGRFASTTGRAIRPVPEPLGYVVGLTNRSLAAVVDIDAARVAARLLAIAAVSPDGGGRNEHKNAK